MAYFFVTLIGKMSWQLRVKTSRVRSCRPEARDVYVSDSLSLVHCDTMLAGRNCGDTANAGRSDSLDTT